MKIRDILKTEQTVSFEFYPPKDNHGIPHVLEVIDRMQSFRPNFISVTYGAGGTTRTLTEEIVFRAKQETSLELMAHLTCVGQTKEEIHGVMDRLAGAGVENVIALRGDPPRGKKIFVPVEGGFTHAVDLIEHAKSNFEFGLAAACYPEGHPESPDLKTDIEYTKRKIDAGADFLITQLFYDNRDFFTFLDLARGAGISTPILAGVLPIVNTSQIRRFTALCGSKIPPKLDEQLERFANDDHAIRELGVEYATEQIRELWDSGVQGIHFYLLNMSFSVSKILNNLRLPNHQFIPIESD